MLYLQLSVIPALHLLAAVVQDVITTIGHLFRPAYGDQLLTGVKVLSYQSLLPTSKNTTIMTFTLGLLAVTKYTISTV